MLLIDGDPQGSLTISLGNPRPDKLPFTLSDAMGRILMDEPLRPGEGILHHPEGVDLMPGSSFFKAPKRTVSWMHSSYRIWVFHLPSSISYHEMPSPDNPNGKSRLPDEHLCQAAVSQTGDWRQDRVLADRAGGSRRGCGPALP